MLTHVSIPTKISGPTRPVIAVLVMGALGFLFTTRDFVKSIDTLSPEQGLLIYYALLGAAIYALQSLGVTVGGIPFDSWLQLVGTLCVTFAFMIVINWTSCYVYEIQDRVCPPESNIFTFSEDGVVYHWVSKLTRNVQARRWITFVLVPMVLCALGLWLLSKS